MTSYYLTADAVDKIQETLDFITKHRDRHYQNDWIRLNYEPSETVRMTPEEAAACGTSGCFAGWMTLFHNAVPANAWRQDNKWSEALQAYVRVWEVDYDAFSVEEETYRLLGGTWHDNQTGNTYHPGPHADLIRHSLDGMFQGGNSVEELWHLGQRLAQGRLKVPASITPVDPEARIRESRYW